MLAHSLLVRLRLFEIALKVEILFFRGTAVEPEFESDFGFDLIPRHKCRGSYYVFQRVDASFSCSFPPAPFFFFCLEVVQVMFQRVEFLFPDCSVSFDPIGDFPEPVQPRLAVPLAPPACNFHQPTFGEDFDMPGDRRAAYPEFLRNAVQRQRLMREETQ